MSGKRTGVLKTWTSAACATLDDLEKLFRQLNDKADDECEGYSQQEYLLQELEHLRDAVSETTEDDLEVK